jgi:hypothetical protein
MRLGETFHRGSFFAPLAVLSPGPRLAGIPSKGEVKEPPGNDGQSDPRTNHQTWNQTEPSSSVIAARFY